MMRHAALKPFEEGLNQAARSICPESWHEEEKLQARFYPVLEAGQLDIGTDFCRELAVSLRRSPGAIARELCEKLPFSLQEQCRFTGQSFGFRLTNDICLALMESPLKIESGCQERIWVTYVPRPSSALSGWAHLRLAFAACSQSLMLHSLGCRVRMCMGDEDFWPSVSMAASGLVREVVLSAAREGVDSRQSTYESIRRLIEENHEATIVLWLSSESVERAKFQELMRGSRSKGIEVRAICPPQTWFAHFDEALPPQSVSDWSDAQLLNLLFYFCSHAEATGLDSQVGRLNEKQNVRWFLYSTLERFAGFGADILDAPSPGLSEIDPGLMGLILRTVFLPVFYSMAANHGAPGDFHRALTDLLTGANSVLNDPSFRGALRRGQSGRAGELYVLGRVEKALRTVISSCLVLREPL